MKHHTSPVVSSFEFDAFISYRTSVIPDSTVGEELQKVLESYPVPRSQQRSIVRPRIFRNRLKVFRDTTDLGAVGNLDETIKARLRVSRWLIVICSPNTPKSNYCNEEVDFFQKVHGNKRVLFLLIAGEPHESFPLSATGVNQGNTSDSGVESTSIPLAADVRAADLPGILAKLRGNKLPKQKQERFKLLAPLLGCSSPDQLIQRHLARERRQIQMATLIALLIAFVIWLIWNVSQKKLEKERIVSIAQTASMDPKVRYLLSEQALALNLPQGLQRRALAAQIQASIDIGFTLLLEACYYGNRPLPAMERTPEGFENGFKTIPGSAASWHWTDFEDTVWTVDFSGRWAFIVGPMGPIMFDLSSKEIDRGVSFYYFPDCNLEIGSGGGTRDAVAVSPNGARIAAFHSDTALGNRIYVWDHPGFPSTVIEATNTDLNDELAFIENGQSLICGKSIWKIAEQLTEPIHLEKEPAFISGDGRWLLASELSSDQYNLPPPPPTLDDKAAATLPPSESTVSKGEEKVYSTLTLWDSQNSFQQSIRSMKSEKEHLQATADYRLRSVSGLEPPTIRALRLGWKIDVHDDWDGDSWKSTTRIDRLTGLKKPFVMVVPKIDRESEETLPVEISPDGKWCVSIDSSLRVWDLSKDEPFSDPVLERKDIHGDRVRFSPDGRWVAVANSEVGGEGSIAWLYKITSNVADWVSVKVPTQGDNRGKDFMDFSSGSEWFIYREPLRVVGSVNLYWRLVPDRELTVADLSPKDRETYFSGRFSLTSRQEANHSDGQEAANHIAAAEKAFEKWKDYFQVDAKAAASQARQTIKDAVAELREAKHLNPTLAFDPGLHVARLAQICFLPAARQLADTGLLTEAEALANVVQEQVPKKFSDSQDQEDLRVRSESYWGKQATEAASRGEDELLKTALERLREQHAKEVEKIAQTTEWTLRSKKFEDLCNGEPTVEMIAKAKDDAKWLVEHETIDNDSSIRHSAYCLKRAGEWLLFHEKVRPSLEFYGWADKLLRQSNESLSGYDFNDICWRGALAGNASLVVDYGRKAVESDPKDARFKDTLALALALSGQLQEAADIYEECDTTQNRPRSSKLLRYWITSLRSGQNPFTPKVIDALKSSGGGKDEDLIEWSAPQNPTRP